MSAGKLYICPTPIGNLGDITQRTLDVLRSVDVICAEDTRVTGRLLAAYKIEKRIERLDEATLSQKLESIGERLLAGESIGYCSDAGMPGVSDPGARLVALARAQGIDVEVLPGPSAGVTAYVASGFTNPQFYFGGFFPRKTKEQKDLLDSLRSLNAALIFYESPKRVAPALATIAEVFPLREIAVCRELTKLHEEVVRGTTAEVSREFSHRSETGAIKGEIVLVIDAPSADEKLVDASREVEGARLRAKELKSDASLSHKDIVAQIQGEYSISRNAAYEIVMDA